MEKTNVVEMVKNLCKERGIPVYKLEKELGFANGYIGQLKKGTLPNDRLLKVANFFDVPVSYFIDDIPDTYFDDDVKAIAMELYRRPELKVLFRTTTKVSSDDLKIVQTLVDGLAKRNED
jgi:transcriptional regulator with XRE-family HTH domain